MLGAPVTTVIGLSCAVVHRGEQQAICVWVSCHLQNLADEDLVAIPGQFAARQADVCDLLDFQASQGQLLRQLLDR
jgi:hypothetical protein